MARTSADERKIAELIGADLVVCIDGPMINQWFHLADWHARRDAALAMNHTPHDVAGAALGYVPVRGEKVGNPSFPGVVGNALSYAPDVAAAAMKGRAA